MLREGWLTKVAAKRALVVDDEKLIVKGIRFSLEQDDMQVDCAYDGEEALELARANRYDIILLDIMLPKLTGFEVCQQIREFSNVPIIMLTAKGDDMDKILGLEYGADDYITKPFSIGALQRKIRAMFAMLEHHRPAKDLYDDGRLFLDFSEQSATLNGKPITLSSMEYKMLYLFCKNPRQVLTRQRLLERLWDVDEKFVDEHTLTTSISRIRGKIEAEGDTYIKTIYGIGYQWTGGERK